MVLEDYPVLHTMLLREVRKQVVVHERVAKLRLYLYYNLRHRVNFLWVQLYHAILEEVAKGVLVRHKDAPGWLYEEGTDLAAVQEAFERKQQIYLEWVGHGGGPHLEKLVRNAFAMQGYSVATRNVTLTWRAEGGERGAEHELDVFAVSPLRIGVECKNMMSDVFISPDIPRKPNDDQKQIARHFKVCQANNIVPILVAPLIDSSFFSFSQQYGGLACRLLFQYLPADKAELCDAIRRELLIGHVRAVEESAPPSNLINWVGRIEKMLEEEP